MDFLNKVNDSFNKGITSNAQFKKAYDAISREAVKEEKLEVIKEEEKDREI